MTPVVLSSWERWRSRQDRKRKLISWGSATGGWLLILALMLWGGFHAPINVGDQGVALAVKLGNPEGEDLPLQVRSIPDPAMQAVLSAQRNSVAHTEETRTDPGPQAIPAPPQKKPKPETSAPSPAPPPISPTTEPVDQH